MKRSFLTLLSILSLTVARAGNDAGLPGEFMNFGAGARPMGMGRAFTAVADDIDALYWNPAGLSTYRSSQVSFQYSPLPLEGAQQYVAYSQPLYALGTFGVGIINVQSPDIPRTDISNVETGSFDHRETGYMAAYAQQFGDRLSFGGTMKMAELSLDGKTERGFGADVGGLWRPFERLRVGAMLRNAIAPTYSFDTEKEEFPRILRTGAAISFLNDHLLTSLDLEKTVGTRQSLRPHLGIEGFVINSIFIRAGWDKTEITTGLGLKWRNLQFDYGAGFQDIGLVNRFTVKMMFGGYEVDVKATPDVFSPVGLKNKVTMKIHAAHRERIVKWIMTIRNSKGDVVQSFQGYNAPPASIEWDGRDAQGRVVEAGQYDYRMMTTDAKNQTEKTPARSIKILAPTPFEIEAK